MPSPRHARRARGAGPAKGSTVSWRLVVTTALLALLVLAAGALWPDVGAVLTLGAAVLLAAGVIAAKRWADRRRREDTEAGTQARGTIPFTGWRNGGL
jgi:hypothetical protein